MPTVRVQEHSKTPYAGVAGFEGRLTVTAIAATVESP
jgi:hypothetical protein